MNLSATCRKVTSLLSAYIDNKLDVETYSFVKNHLEICPDCHRRYVTLKKLLRDLRNAYKDLQTESTNRQNNRMFNIKEYEAFHCNLSSYFDNELPLNESVNMKKYMIKFSNARRALEEMYRLHKLINNSVSCVKKNANKDYAKVVIYRVKGITPTSKKTAYLKAAAFFSVLLLLAVMFLSTLPQGKSAIEKGIKFFKKNIYVESPLKPELAIDLMY